MEGDGAEGDGAGGDGAESEVKGVGIDAARGDAVDWDKFDAVLDISASVIDEPCDVTDLNGVGGGSMSGSSKVTVVVDSGIIAEDSTKREATSSTTFVSSTFLSST